MESTSIYWMPVWRVLENYVSLKLVNPYFIKQLPGKKSDVKDAEWIATCLLKDLIKGSYVPDDLIQQLRQYDRRISDLNAECVRKLGKLDVALQRCNIRISNYMSHTDTKSYKEVVRLISEEHVTLRNWRRSYMVAPSIVSARISSRHLSRVSYQKRILI